MNLIKYDAACRAVAVAKTVDEVKDIMDKSKAIEAYGRQAKNRDIEADGFEIRMRAERRLGQMLAELPMNTGTKGQLRGKSSGGAKVEPPENETPTLAELGLNKKLSSSSQKTASMPEEEFETKVASGRDKIKDAVKSAHVSNNSGENEWYTPLIYIDSARKVMKTIDLDPASSETANKNVKAKNYNTEKINGLDMDWTGNVWLNPPYSQPLIKQFSEKLLKELSHISQAIVLVNNATETNWLQPLIEKCAAACFVKGRIRFVDKNGKAGTAPLQGQVILYFGNRTVSFRTEFSKHGHILLNEI